MKSIAFLKFVFLMTTLLGFWALLGCRTVEEDDLISQDCTGDCAKISGRFTTGDGYKALAGITLQIKWVERGLVRTKAKVVTDFFGDYEFNFAVRDDETGGDYIMEALVDNYYNCSGYEYPTLTLPSLNNNSWLTIDSFTPYKASVLLKAANVGQMAATDTLTVIIGMGEDINGGESCSSQEYWKSTEPDKQIILDVSAQQPHILTTISTKQGISTTTLDTLMLNQDERKEFVVTFQ